ncbi:MAG: hypothetical protein LBM74_07730 [Oscillospiraceae bacterium]|nr:hypothetical protein [Oscillospiraceae bacterium]
MLTNNEMKQLRQNPYYKKTNNGWAVVRLALDAPMKGKLPFDLNTDKSIKVVFTFILSIILRSLVFAYKVIHFRDKVFQDMLDRSVETYSIQNLAERRFSVFSISSEMINFTKDCVLELVENRTLRDVIFCEIACKKADEVDACVAELKARISQAYKPYLTTLVILEKFLQRMKVQKMGFSSEQINEITQIIDNSFASGNLTNKEPANDESQAS